MAIDNQHSVFTPDYELEAMWDAEQDYQEERDLERMEQQAQEDAWRREQEALRRDAEANRIQEAQSVVNNEAQIQAGYANQAASARYEAATEREHGNVEAAQEAEVEAQTVTTLSYVDPNGVDDVAIAYDGAEF